MSPKLRTLRASTALFAGVISFAAAGVALFDRFVAGEPVPNSALREKHHQTSVSDEQHEISVQTRLTESITEQMEIRNCHYDRIDILGLDEQQTPAAETASGLDGHYIAATLRVVGSRYEVPVSLQAEGNGKGPVAKSQAYDGLRESIENQLNELVHCEEQSE